MKVVSLVAISSIGLNGCGLLPTVYYDTNNGTYEVAQHNYETLLSAQDDRKDYLLVDENGNATPKNIFIYINGLREPLQKYKLATQNLIQYNKSIMQEIRKK